MLQQLTYNTIKETALNINALSNTFNNICIFDSNNHAYEKASKLIAIEATEELIIYQPDNALKKLQEFIDKHKGWVFGYLSYDLKNDIEELISKNKDGLQFPTLHFFVPKIVIEIKEGLSIIHFDDKVISSKEVADIYALSFTPNDDKRDISRRINIAPKISKQEYINSVNNLKEHIRKGDIYEVNFCQEFFATDTIINPVNVYENLNKISSAPFAAYSKFKNHYLLCSSPERFLQKKGSKLISQPIKGTIKRSKNKEEDEILKQDLKNSIKERSENVMIVDLVRNDLSRIAKNGSVNVDELFGIYTFKQVHQMISTISCELKENTTFTDIIKNTFPMGSMTGAPKISAMNLIEKYESTKRGLYSGAIGYIDPNGNFDFNVVIRSILYNAQNKYLSFMVGSAITEKSNAEQEYEECLLKAKALFEVLRGEN